MSATLIPQMLDVGLAAIQLASGDGVRLRITHVALGDAGYSPTADQVGLRHEIVRYPIADGKTVGPRQLHLTALADDSAEFWVREVGFVLENGAFLALWSDPARALAYKQAGLELLLAYDLTLAGVPPDSVIVQSTGAGLNLHLAEELASFAASAVAGMQVDLQQDAQLSAHSRALTALSNSVSALDRRDMSSTTEHANQLTALAHADQQATQRIDQLASQQAAEHNNLLAIQAANAAAIVDLQNHYLKGTT
ncbi:phage tail protein [Chromobacterium piscinae]|uniref:Phage tail protein n=1 Tax=Chromobacterium piscinae TaxID=686831 RepID=A0ABV0H1T5_9NEIS